MRQVTTPQRAVLALASLIAAALVLVGCTSQPSSQQKESNLQQQSYDALAGHQPAKTMPYSPTRDTINFWIDTWKQPDKLSYAYLQNANGDLIGYYVLKGLPVSYCTSLTPTYDILNPSGAGNVVVPAPAMDGAYYSGRGCNSYYGKDASTGAYIEYTVGLGINVLLYDQPLPNRPNVQPLGPTKIER